mmetsp:Transcript_20271/g.36156  ORF Transcript_20271/g.36156 Transcript_20271/m.36156 type:complete len:118 (-) Transcript_20271:135-488(-)|eukprot:CAMPEP_0177757696 /NCGR_PEP_ID=MMETSP0491_2-20121128/3779_1 /TAXON_ID=63592 /ORGANISM="Tetraselmis chuii, Strain PLY429" /LENGTH=117 /DNA_ID=CAMNT_0019273361 /DNA_START=341 /DNA_END=694 /DNA_ORIENTATION=-
MGSDAAPQVTVKGGNMTKEVRTFHTGLEVGLRCLVREPLLGLSMVEDHVQNSSPAIVRQRVKLEGVIESMQGASYAVTSCVDTVQVMKAVGPQKLEGIREQLARASSAARRCNRNAR